MEQGHSIAFWGSGVGDFNLSCARCKLFVKELPGHMLYLSCGQAIPILLSPGCLFRGWW